MVKKLLKYAGLCSIVLTIVAFILLMSTSALYYDANSKVAGTIALFGDGNLKSSGVALAAWILLIIALLVLICIAVLPSLKLKVSPLIVVCSNLFAVLALIVAGILVFTTKSAFMDANGLIGAFLADYNLGAGYVISGILLLLAGLVAVAPLVYNLIEKKK